MNLSADPSFAVVFDWLTGILSARNAPSIASPKAADGAR